MCSIFNKVKTPLNPHEESQPIKNDLVRRWMDDSEEGLVIFSMGSMVSEMSEEKANLVAETFASLKPLRFLWRYQEKKRPTKLGDNTLIQGRL